MRSPASILSAPVSLVAALLIAAVPSTAGVLFLDPTGGWDYIYTGDVADPTAGAALDGNWNYTNGSSTWSGDLPNEAGKPDGGVGVVPVTGEAGNNALLIVDSQTADPNRKIAILRDLSSVIPADPFLDDGFTMSLRVRLPSSVADLPTAPDGYVLHDGNKGMFIIRQAGGTLSLTLGMADRDSTFTTGNGLLIADGTASKYLAIDPTAWNELWLTAIQNVDDPARYDVKIWNNGAFAAPVFTDTVALATGTEGTFPTYMAMQLGATPQVGAVEVDFFAVKDGVHEPPPPAPGDLLALFQSTPATITAGQSATLRWTVAPGATVSIAPGIGNVTAQTNASGNGSIAVTPAVDTTYTISVTNPTGNKTATATVQVRPLASFQFDNTFVNSGAAVTLSWRIRADATVSISNVANAAANTGANGIGSVVVHPVTSTTYTITASASGRSEQASLRVVVRPSLPTYALIDLGGTGGRAEPGAVGDAVVGAGPHNTNGTDLPATDLTSDTGDAFTIAVSNLDPSDNPVGGLDWRDRGDTPALRGLCQE